MSKSTYYSLRSLSHFMRKYRLQLALVVAVFIVSDAFLALIPIFIGKLIGSAVAGQAHYHQAIIYAWLLVACSTGHDLFWRLAEFSYIRLVGPISYNYENLLFKRIITKPYPYFVDKFTGKVASNVSTISDETQQLLENVCFNYAASVVSIVSITFILGSINWQTGVVFVFGLIGMVFVGRYTIGKMNGAEKVSTDVQSTKKGQMIDAIANFMNVKSFQKEGHEIKNIETEQIKAYRAARKSFNWATVFWASQSLFVRELIWPISIAINMYLFLHGQLSIGQLTTLLTTILLFSNSVWELIWYISQFNLRMARTEEAHRYLFGKTILDTASDSAASPQVHYQQSLELKNLSFAYPDKPETEVLTNINLTITRGKKIGIVGKSGSGKSTLTKLLLGYYVVDNGHVLLDGQSVATNDLASVISYVPQDTSLFHRTISQNIAYATDRAVTQADVEEAAKQAHAHEFIVGITDGYDALVGERGVKLSAGQRQRIAIARAFLDDKPLLILDEATSALDSESEVLVQMGLENLWEQKTVIAIAHRLSTLRHMDEILVMDNGKIVERGSHTELLAKKGKYAKLWNHQSGGFIEE